MRSSLGSLQTFPIFLFYTVGSPVAGSLPALHLLPSCPTYLCFFLLPLGSAVLLSYGKCAPWSTGMWSALAMDHSVVSAHGGILGRGAMGP